jgi:Uma2 family endonuclease
MSAGHHAWSYGRSMQAAHPFSPADLLRAVEDRFVLRGLRWEDYLALLDARGERAWPRITYLDGEIELMAPSDGHEWIKKTTARLLEAYAEEHNLQLNGTGSRTLKRKVKQAGAEADESYSLGPVSGMPDLAIEVSWSRNDLDKLEVYRRLGVREVWLWHRGAFQVHVLRGGRYARVEGSELFPELDLEWLATFLDTDDQTAAVKRFRKALRSKKRRAK